MAHIFETRFYVLSLWAKGWSWHYNKMKMNDIVCKLQGWPPCVPLSSSVRNQAHSGFPQTLWQIPALGYSYSLPCWTWKQMASSITQSPLKTDRFQTESSRVVSPQIQKCEEVRGLSHICGDTSVERSIVWLLASQPHFLLLVVS